MNRWNRRRSSSSGAAPSPAGATPGSGAARSGQGTGLPGVSDGAAEPSGTAGTAGTDRKEPGAGAWAAYRQLLRPFRTQAVLAVALLLARSGLDLGIPQIFRWLLDVAIPAGDLRRLAMGALVALALVGTRAAVHYAAVYVSFDLTQRVVHELRVRLYRHILSLPLAFFHRERQGAVVARLTTDTGAVERFIQAVFARLAGEFGGVLAVVATVVALQPALGLGLVLLLPLAGAWFYLQTVRIRSLSREIQAQAGRIGAAATEAVGAIATVKAFGGETREAGRLAAASQRYRALNMARRRFIGRMESGADLMGNLGLLLLFFAGGYLAIAGRLSPGTLAALVLYLRMMLAPVRSLVNFHLILQEGLAAMERVQEILQLPAEGVPPAGGNREAAAGGGPDRPDRLLPPEAGGEVRAGAGQDGRGAVAVPAIAGAGPSRPAGGPALPQGAQRPPGGPGAPGGGGGAGAAGAAAGAEALPRPGAAGRPGRPSPAGAALELAGVWFRYRPGDPPVLRGVNLRVEPGERIALVGPSGAGKTTLLHLIPRFYDPEQGVVLLDGQDVRRFDLAELRRQVAWVMQDPVLFSGTVADNIAYGCPGASRAAIQRAAELANAAGFIAALPQGYDTPVGERGVRLSGGQRQRIAIARALLRRPRLLLLDEATSFQDAESEERIHQALDLLAAGGCTSIVVAHRLSTALRADRVVVLDGGRVVEAGTHAQLIARGGLYARLYRTFFSPRGPGRPRPGLPAGGTGTGD
ncbi:ABC transporter ATP-binding protein [Thermaerobacter subterraneus]|uniref:ABC-type bacteriocin/lantibiotic exporter with N-terminal double-glycine peptidase domain n=1 Tax=Thermaerobacter subterraneus DSM 13965 TaxID=867903 RepID=K6Q0E1_9FIRM|nr:ABC transporter ATP-binding protein [Thermaerobacter subterraneus]EKP94369.1 ABC-type bacteriocin/lantibiotic exporter with N-terminal double-glycine peptidase domain [Thermaerobacter subterraneus DSM 13965]